MRASFPQAQITMVVSPYNRVVMERNSDVDTLVELPRGVKPSLFGERYRGYDLAIALAPRGPDLQLVGATRARVRVGYTYVRRWLARASARLYVNRLLISEADPDLCEREPRRIVRHEVEQLLDLVALGGATTRIEELRLDLTEADRAAVATLPEAPLVFHLGQRWFEAGSTLASTLELVAGLRELGRAVVVTCAAECTAFAEPFEAVADRVLRDLPFHHWAALFARAACVVTVDTGATHVASAMRRPTLVAFEHRYFRLNSQEWAPYRVPNVLVRKPESQAAAALSRFRAEIVDGAARLMNA